MHDAGMQQIYTQEEQASAMGGLQSEVGAMRSDIKELLGKQGNVDHRKYLRFLWLVRITVNYKYV